MTETKPTLAPVRWSNLKNIGRSPAHYKYFLDNPITPTSAMCVGSIAHQRVLGGSRMFAVYPGAVRRGKEWEAWRNRQPAECEIVTEREMDLASDVAAAVLNHPGAVEALSRGEREKQLFWEIAGRACRGTPDVLGIDLADLKTTNDASPDRFQWHARKMGWIGQLAWYRNASIEVYGVAPERVSIVAVESAPPHVVTVYDLTEEALLLGEKTWRLYLERLRACEESDYWPGYVEGVARLDVPESEEELILTIDGEEISA